MVNLVALAKAGFERADKRLWGREIAHGAILVLAVLTLLLPGGFQYIFAIVAAVAEVLSFFLRQSAQEIYLKSREVQRRGLIINSLGDVVDPMDMADLRQRMSELDKKAQSFETSVEKYYGSTLPLGFARLKENLEESAFFSKNLYSQAIRWSAVKLCAGLVIVILMLLCLPLLHDHKTPKSSDNVAKAGKVDAPQTSPIVDEARPDDVNRMRELLAQVAILFFVFVISGENIEDLIAYYRAERAVSDVDHRLQRTNPDEHDRMMMAFADYVLATSITPRVSSTLYSKHRDALNAAWTEHRRRQSGSTTR